MSLMGSSAEWTWLRKESVSLKIYQQRLLKLNCKGKNKNEILKEASIISEGVTCNWKTRRKRDEGTKKYVNL